MKTQKFISILILLFLTINTIGQTKKYKLEWKINKNDTLCYQTMMKETIVNKRTSTFFDNIPDSANLKEAILKLNEELNNTDTKYMTYLSCKSDSFIDITMRAIDNSGLEMLKSDTLDEKQKEFLKSIISASNSVVLRGEVYKSGEIKSFWLKHKQKNLIALLFQLPNKPVSVGDTWELDVNLVQADQNFICKSCSKINNAKLVSIENKGEDKIALIKYDFQEVLKGILTPVSFFGEKNEPIKTDILVTHKAIAKFSINKGKWISYEGDLDYSVTGFMDKKSNTRFVLIESQ